MTERITTLLQEEADSLAAPSIDARAVINAGRRRRRRSGGFQLVAAAAVVGVVAASAVTWIDARSSNDYVSATSGVVDGGSEWAVANGSTVHLGSGGTVELPGQVKSLYYVKDGVLARTGKTAATDAPDSNYWLIDEGGEVTDFELSLGDRVPGTDPDQPYLAYAEPGKDATHWTVVLRDVRTGGVTTSIPIEGAFTWGGWVAPPVALDGGHVYVGVDEALLDVDWAAGTVTPSATLPGSYMPTVRNGVEIIEEWHENATGAKGDPMNTGKVINVRTGDETPLPSDLDETAAALSSTGQSVLLSSYRMCQDDGSCEFDDPVGRLFDLATSDSREVALTGNAVGWTRDGELVQVNADTVTVCGDNGCTSTPMKVGKGDLRVAGSIYES